jgi:hypothetical protein
VQTTLRRGAPEGRLLLLLLLLLLGGLGRWVPRYIGGQYLV